MADADEEIREIKREIIESRGLVIKTSNLTNSLAASDVAAVHVGSGGVATKNGTAFTAMARRPNFWISAQVRELSACTPREPAPSCTARHPR